MRRSCGSLVGQVRLRVGLRSLPCCTLLHLSLLIPHSYRSAAIDAVINSYWQLGSRRSICNSAHCDCTVCRIHLRATEHRTSTRHTMAPRLAFMDLSVDLKTLIIQHVSLLHSVRSRPQGWKKNTWELCSESNTTLTESGVDQPPDRPQERLPHL